jgi:hypothetical protein
MSTDVSKVRVASIIRAMNELTYRVTHVASIKSQCAVLIMVIYLRLFVPLA